MTDSTIAIPATRAPSARANWLATPAFYWGLLALYLASHVLLRLWETPNIGKNEVQEAIAAQGWSWGYHPRNPPLHTWLLMGSYSIFGVGVLAHVVLKYVLLGATYAFAYLCGRRLLSNATLAALSALSLTLISPFAWTVHTALTHTLLLATMIFVTLWAALRLTENRRVGDYMVFGAALGLGFLTKYSFPLFLIPLLAAMLAQGELRRALFNWRMLIGLGVAALLFAPHAIWMATARFDFVEFLAEKQRSEVAQPYLVDIATGLGSVAVGALSFLSPFILVFGIVFVLGAKRTPAAPASAWARAVWTLPAFGLALLVLDVFVLRATQFEQRYFLCALLTAPLALFQWLDLRTPELSPKRIGWFVASVAVGALIVVGGLTGRALFFNRTCTRCVDEMPTAEFADRIRAAGFTGGTIVADHYNVAGNMRLVLPHARVVAANYGMHQPLGDANGQCVLVWNGRNAGDPIPSLLTSYLARTNLALPEGGPTYVDAPLRRSENRMDRLAYWILPNADGNCRPL